MSTQMTLTPIPDYAGVRVELVDAPPGEAVILRTDANGTRPVRQAAGAVVSAGLLQLVDYEAALVGPISYACTGQRVNAITNSNFEVDAAGWFGTRGTAGTSITSPYEGVRTGTYTSTDASTANGNYLVSNTWAVTPGQTWTASATVSPWGSAGVSTFQCALQWLVGGTWGYYSGAPASTYAGTAPGVKVRMRNTSTAPAGATMGRLVVYCRPDAGGGMPVNSGFGIDAVLAEQTSELRDYVAGTVPLAVSASTSLDGLVAGPVVASVVRPGERRDLAGVQTYREHRAGAAVVHTPLGRDGDPVVLLRRPGPRAVEAGLYARTYEEAAGIEATVAAGDVILLRQVTYPGMDAYGVVTATDLQPWHVDELDDVDWLVTVSYLEVPAPGDPLAGGAAWTYADAAALGVTYAQLRGLFASYYDLAVGT